MLIEVTEEVKIAKSNLVCYKKVDAVYGVENTFKPYYYIGTKVRYVLGDLNTTTIEEVKLGLNEAEGAFDSQERIDYGIEDHDVLYNTTLDNYGLKLIGSGFHSSKTIKRISSNHYSKYGVYVKCIIPKGSEYYLNKSGLYVSNKLIISKIVKP